MSITLQIVLTIVTVIIAIILGLLLRRWLVQRLKNTVLDTWAIQTLGIVIFVPPLLLGAAIIPVIWNPGIIFSYWANIQTQFQAKHIDLTAILGNTIETLLLIGLGIGVARTMQKVIIRGLGENRIDINIRTLIGRIFYIIILTFTAFWILSVWQVSIGIPVAAITVITVAATFTVQDILKDLVAGFYILLERPFHIGDQISTATYTGRVEDVQLRATKLRLLSGEEVTIPNALVFGGTVVNNTHYGERRATITVTLDEAEFVQGETAENMLKAIQELEQVMVKPEPSVLLTGFTAEKKAVLLIRFWVASRQPSTVSDVVYILHKVLPNADLTVTEAAGNL
jgi:small-conductance mechanosensitive channel